MAKAQIIETFITQGQLLEQASKNDAILCRAKYQICSIGEKNRNNRVYEKAVWDKVLADPEIKAKLQNRSLFFHAEHPSTTQSNTEKVAGIVTDINLDEKDKVYAIMEVLDTPYGRIVDTLLRAGCGIGVSTRADGELEEALDEAGAKYQRVIPESYRFVTVDFTADPSSFGSEMPLSIQHNISSIIKKGLDNEKIDRDYATTVLENMQTPEAVALLESIKNDQHHPDCKCKTSEKKCTKGCSKGITEAKIEAGEYDEVRGNDVVGQIKLDKDTVGKIVRKPNNQTEDYVIKLKTGQFINVSGSSLIETRIDEEQIPLVLFYGPNTKHVATYNKATGELYYGGIDKDAMKFSKTDKVTSMKTAKEILKNAGIRWEKEVNNNSWEVDESKKETGVCNVCKTKFPLGKLLTTGQVDDKDELLVCPKCDKGDIQTGLDDRLGESKKPVDIICSACGWSGELTALSKGQDDRVQCPACKTRIYVGKNENVNEGDLQTNLSRLGFNFKSAYYNDFGLHNIVLVIYNSGSEAQSYTPNQILSQSLYDGLIDYLDKDLLLGIKADKIKWSIVKPTVNVTTGAKLIIVDQNGNIRNIDKINEFKVKETMKRVKCHNCNNNNYYDDMNDPLIPCEYCGSKDWGVEEPVNEVIKKIGDKWQVQSHKGKNLGTYDTEAGAKKRLGQVEYFKHRNEGKGMSKKQLEEYADELTQKIADTKDNAEADNLRAELDAIEIEIGRTDEKYTTSSDNSGQPANAEAADKVAKKSAAKSGVKITEVREDIQMKTNESEVKQYLTENRNLFKSEQEAIDNLVKVFKIGESDARNYIQQVSTSAVKSTMNNEKIQSSDAKLDEASQRLVSLTAEHNKLVESYANDVVDLTVKIKRLKEDVLPIKEALELEKLENAKLKAQLEKSNEDRRILEENNTQTIQTIQKERSAEIERITEEKQKEIKDLNEAHRSELLKIYVDSRLKSMNLRLPQQFLTILESCRTTEQIEMEIKHIQDQLREGLLQFNNMSEVIVRNNIPVDPKQLDISNKIELALKTFGT